MDLEPAVDTLCSNPAAVQELEQYVTTWQTHIAIVIEEQQQKHPQVRYCCPEFLTMAGLSLS